MITSNTFNFPFELDGEECYQEREDYVARLADKAEKKAERERAAAEKKAKAEAKKKAKEKAE